MDITIDETTCEFYPGLTRYFATVTIPKQGATELIITRYHDGRKSTIADASDGDVHPVIARLVLNEFREFLAKNNVQSDY